MINPSVTTAGAARVAIEHLVSLLLLCPFTVPVHWGTNHFTRCSISCLSVCPRQAYLASGMRAPKDFSFFRIFLLLEHLNTVCMLVWHCTVPYVQYQYPLYFTHKGCRNTQSTPKVVTFGRSSRSSTKTSPSCCTSAKSSVIKLIVYY